MTENNDSNDTTTSPTKKKRTSRLLKGTIAGAAGIALLLGGAGTFALWQVQDEIGSEAVITKGHLEIASSAGAWHDVTFDDSDGPIANIENYLIAPGAVLEYRANLRVVAEGENLRARFDVATGELVEMYDGNVDKQVFVGGQELDGAPDVADLQSGEQNVPVTVRLTFHNEGDGEANATMFQSMRLTDLTISLTQVPMDQLGA